MNLFRYLVVVMLVSMAGIARSADNFSSEQIAFFEKRIRPVLVAQCYACHSSESPQVKGGLLLDTRMGVDRGGESGRVVEPGDPEMSLLIQALRYADDAPAMPPRKQLSEEVIADFEAWVTMGVPDPRQGEAVAIGHEIDIEKGRRFWAFVAPRDWPIPRVRDESWPRSTIDHFLLKSLEQQSLKPVSDSDASILVRRLYLDLTGLPPTPAEMDRWQPRLSAASARPKAAFASIAEPSIQESSSVDFETALSSLVDELLASPHFGERWGRHWLDVARFAETSGRQINYNYPHAWRYRDWVVSAFNADLPYDAFIRQQIAGDLLSAENDDQRAAQLIATGFLAIGPKAHSERDSLQFQMDLVDEQIDVTTQAFMGLSVACARCHDHKFDPVPQRDYYALAGIFRSTETCYGTVRIIQSLNASPLQQLPEASTLPSALPILTIDAFNTLKNQLAEVKGRFDELTKAGQPTTGRDFNLIGTLTAKVDDYNEDGRPKGKAMAVRDRSLPIDSPLYDRGETDKPCEIVARGFVQVVNERSIAISSSNSGRLELAEWIASRDNPLTARVIVNRVWTYLFGRGIVSTPDNFGAAGAAPDNLALLDHLAIGFMNDDWSVKRLIRRIVLCRAYRLSSRHDKRNFEQDPDNARVWRMTPQRLDAEVIRDCLLDIAGRLDRTPPIGSPVALAGEDNSNSLLRKLTAIDLEHIHRAMYLPVIRDSLVESLALFDFADPSLVIGQRSTTTVPAQSLYLLNSPFVQMQVEAAARRLLNEADDDARRLTLAYRWFFGRLPVDLERQASERFMSEYLIAIDADRMTAERRAVAVWAAFCQALVASGDFLYRH